jgi:hypothetical protein
MQLHWKFQVFGVAFAAIIALAWLHEFRESSHREGLDVALRTIEEMKANPEPQPSTPRAPRRQHASTRPPSLITLSNTTGRDKSAQGPNSSRV